MERAALPVKTYGEVRGSFGPDEVGSHPASDSPFGIADLAGNVEEFIDVPGEVAATRGGGWYDSARTLSSSHNIGNERNYRDAQVGVRLCATPR